MAAAAAELGVGGVNRGVDLLASVCFVRLPTTRPAAPLLYSIIHKFFTELFIPEKDVKPPRDRFKKFKRRF